MTRLGKKFSWFEMRRINACWILINMDTRLQKDGFPLWSTTKHRRQQPTATTSAVHSYYPHFIALLYETHVALECWNFEQIEVDRSTHFGDWIWHQFHSLNVTPLLKQDHISAIFLSNVHAQGARRNKIDFTSNCCSIVFNALHLFVYNFAKSSMKIMFHS